MITYAPWRWQGCVISQSPPTKKTCWWGSVQRVVGERLTAPREAAPQLGRLPRGQPGDHLLLQGGDLRPVPVEQLLPGRGQREDEPTPIVRVAMPHDEP